MTSPLVLNYSNDREGSTEMHTMYEALARERTRVSEAEAQQLRVVRELASARRWHRVELRAGALQRRAQAARRRHVRRVA